MILLRAKDIDFEITHIDLADKPDWFLKISPHGKVPVLSVNGEPLFESNAIAEYLDETVAPRLHPADPVKRAQNRAWTDYVPIFSDVTHLTNATGKADLDVRRGNADIRFAKLEGALQLRGNDGPFFNGPDFSLVDASYAPSLLRFTLFDRVYPIGLIENYPLVAAWRDALIARPSVINSVVPDFEDYWREQLVVRGRWVAQYLGAAAAE